MAISLKAAFGTFFGVGAVDQDAVLVDPGHPAGQGVHVERVAVDDEVGVLARFDGAEFSVQSHELCGAEGGAARTPAAMARVRRQLLGRG